MRRRLLAFIASAVLLPATAAGTAAADGPSVQDVGQWAGSQQSATSSASSTQVQPSNKNISVRIGSPGDGGAVTQDNSSAALSAAGNTNDTSQQAGQSAGGSGVQMADQSAANHQSADSSASSTQVKPSNTNISVRIGSPGDDGSVTQTNSSKATSDAGNKNTTNQSAGQSGGGSGGTQNVGQDASNKQDATSDATSKQDHPSNVNIPVRIFSDGNDGSVTQTNSSSAVSAAGNKNETTQQSEQGSGAPSAPVRDACGGGCGDHGGPSVQDAEQSASNEQSADSSASSEQDHAKNVNVPVRIYSRGGDGDVTQTNSSSAVSAAGNKNGTDQSAGQSAGGSGGSAVQYAGQKADSSQVASSDATSHQSGASNANYPVRIGSSGGGGDVTQTNSSSAVSAAGNKNETSQDASQDAGYGSPTMVLDGCADKCGNHGGSAVQYVKQSADNEQSADSSADSTQCCASNSNSPVRIESSGGDGDVTQTNSSSAVSAAGNKNETEQSADQAAGAGGGYTCDTCGDHGAGTVVQPIGQWAGNEQSAESSADSTQCCASNSNSPVRIKSDGGDGDVTQSNSSSAVSAAGNKNDTDQSAEQSAGSGDVTVQAIGQWADSSQDASSEASSEQFSPSNSNSPVFIKSASDGGDVSQSNSSSAVSAAGNENETSQDASQGGGGSWEPLVRDAGCGSCGGGDGTVVQAVGQWAGNEQSADSSADSLQKDACNANSPVRIKSDGGDGDVTQSNSSSANSAAGNENDTEQSADQSAGGWGATDVQAVGQKAGNYQDASSDASSEQFWPSNSNSPVSFKSAGGGGSVEQSNASLAASAAGNRNETCQRAWQGSGSGTGCHSKKERRPLATRRVS
jgi:hypothetical protein